MLDMADEEDLYAKTTLSSTPSGAQSGSYMHVVGTTVGGRYQVQKLVGQGGMGALYAAEHIDIGRKVAIKVLNRDFRVSDDIFLRFKNEAKLAATLNHNNICSVYDFGKLDDGTPYLVMDLLQGKTLSHMITKDGRLEPNLTVRMIAQVCDGLTHAHSRDVVHRDLKPSNIMVEETEQGEIAKIVDFGIAKSLEVNAPSLTATHETIGSPYYMSPEQCQAQPVDRRTDIYSLGCLMYECLAGRPPFQASNALQMMYSHVNSQPDPFSVTVPDAVIPDKLEAVILKAMAKNPADRYQATEDLKQAAFDAVGAKSIDCLAVNPESEAFRKKLAELEKAKGGAVAAATVGGAVSKTKNKPLILGIVATLLVGAVAFAAVNAENIQLLMDGRRPGYVYNGDENRPLIFQCNAVSNPQVHMFYLGQAHDTPRSQDNNPEFMGHATVIVSKATPSVILVLGSSAQIEWNIVKEPGTKVEKVIVFSVFNKSQVKGVPETIVERITTRNENESFALMLLEGEDLFKCSNFKYIADRVKDATGKPINTLQYAGQIKEFVTEAPKLPQILQNLIRNQK